MENATYFEGELHHGQHMDLGFLPVSGYTLSDLLRLQTAHGVVLVSGEAYFRPQDLCQSCERSRTRSVWGTGMCGNSAGTYLQLKASCCSALSRHLYIFISGLSCSKELQPSILVCTLHKQQTVEWPFLKSKKTKNNLDMLYVGSRAQTLLWDNRRTKLYFSLFQFHAELIEAKVIREWVHVVWALHYSKVEQTVTHASPEDCLPPHEDNTYWSGSLLQTD